MQEVVRKTITKAEERYGCINISKRLVMILDSSGFTGDRVKVICGKKKILARLYRGTRTYRIVSQREAPGSLRQFMMQVGLTAGTPIELLWRKPGELVIRIVKKAKLRKAELGQSIDEGRIYDHNQVRDIIRELGELKGFYAEVEHPMDGRRLDVVWKKVREGAPLAVFEVHIRGNIFEAFLKLMRARERWPGVEIFLVTTSEHVKRAKDEVRELTIASALHVVNCDDIMELYELVKRARELERRCNLP